MGTRRDQPEAGTAAGAMPAALARRFRERAGPAATLSFADFMELALFDRTAGYYTAERERVGRGRESDFFTSSCLDLVFGPLVAAAAAAILGRGRTADHVFVELGAEPGRSVVGEAAHGFAGTQTIRLGAELVIPPRAVVFSNELFDAQPFRRAVFRDGRWRELGVALHDGSPRWAELAELSGELQAAELALPPAPEGYTLDLPLRAARLLARIVAQPWTGLFLTVDYGRTWAELTRDYPQGTGRAYSRQRQSGDLLANPGQQDLTCHLCWDWLEQALRDAGFSRIQRESQEAFFVHHAAEEIAAIMAADPDPLARARSQLKHLLHPALMGQRFEALWAVR